MNKSRKKSRDHDFNRRDFLKVFGYGIGSAVVLAACRRTVQNALPYIIQPPEITPGKALYYASGYYDGHEYASILVKTRDGRPIKIEGNSLSAFNREGTTARVQASVLSLYDDARLKNPSVDNTETTWETVDARIMSDLAKINAEGGEIVLLTSSIISPSTKRLIQEFGKGFGKFRWIQYDAVSYSAIIEANGICFGKPAIPDYNFSKAGVVVSINADFLGTWISPVHFIPGYTSRRKPGNVKEEMLRHIHFGSGVTITGSNADVRKKLKPSEEKILLTDLHNRIAELTGQEKLPGTRFREDITDLASELFASKGRSIVMSGSNNVGIQIIVNRINNMLGNYPQCIDLNNNLNIASGIDGDILNLVNDMKAGRVGALLLFNVNPVYDYPASQDFIAGLKKTGLTVNMGVSLNETVGKAKYECPVNHFLESWDDAEIIPGQLSLAQPCISPIFNTRSFQDSLLKWSGKTADYHGYLKAAWEEAYFPHSGMPVFSDFWNKSLGSGVFSYNLPGKEVWQFSQEAMIHPALKQGNTAENGFEIILAESIPMGSGQHGNNPWLMELPDPVSKHCWENVASVSQHDAQDLGIVTGDLIQIREGLILPAIVQPGQTEETISVAIGYGRTNSGPVADGKGVNVYSYVDMTDGNRAYGFATNKPVKTGGHAGLALTQLHDLMEGRPIVRFTNLSKYKVDPSSGNEFHEDFESGHRTLYPEIKYDGFHWGMAIDLNLCVGCNACVIACQAENNVPTVGKSEVTRHRIMHWLKIDRYYSDEQENPMVFFQPLTCQHCDNAPCENVCPVSATNHSSEGLNQMAYNRCVGTKYCINNCPYRVRRFNWFRYTNNKAFDFNSASDLGKMVLNPDVTVRERGVVEKCSFCVQRIQEKKLQAKLENRKLADSEIKTACMQACPAGAIVFGNRNDADSRVSTLFSDPRSYGLLEDLHTLPATRFLTKVWNDEMKSS
jgi:molybdopterin-containing oxidoreductase family iron-sulfur binding subunit